MPQNIPKYICNYRFFIDFWWEMERAYNNNAYTANQQIDSRRINYERVRCRLNIDKQNETNQYLRRLKKKDRQLITYNHSIKVGKLSKQFAKYLDCVPAYCEIIEIAGKLHDVGKLRIPLKVLVKPTKLTEKEFHVVKKHAIIGYHMLKDAGYPRIVYEVAGGHHMSCVTIRGYGYAPYGAPVPLHCKIVMCCDIFEAISAKRHYKEEMSIDDAIVQFRKEERIDDVMKNAFLDFLEKNRDDVTRILKF